MEDKEERIRRVCAMLRDGKKNNEIKEAFRKEGFIVPSNDMLAEARKRLGIPGRQSGLKKTTGRIGLVRELLAEGLHPNDVIQRCAEKGFKKPSRSSVFHAAAKMRDDGVPGVREPMRPSGPRKKKNANAQILIEDEDGGQDESIARMKASLVRWMKKESIERITMSGEDLIIEVRKTIKV